MKMKGEKKEKKENGNWLFLVAVLLLYPVCYLIKPAQTIEALEFSLTTLVRIAPTLALVIIFMALMNYFLSPKTIAKNMGEGSGLRGYLVATVSGIISSGPIFIWYPFLEQLQKNGVKNALIATFLYSRAIKIPFIPILIAYFGLKFTVVLTVVTFATSMIQGGMIELIERWRPVDNDIE